MKVTFTIEQNSGGTYIKQSPSCGIAQVYGSQGTDEASEAEALRWLASYLLERAGHLDNTPDNGNAPAQAQKMLNENNSLLGTRAFVVQEVAQ